MRINISERLRPYSHEAGVYCLLPGSTLRLQVFPALIRVHDLSGPEPVLRQEIAWDILGPVKDFTVQQDLEKGYVTIWGHALNGYMRYHCTSDQNNASIVVEKMPEFVPAAREPAKRPPAPFERLSLGNHKAQDWTMMSRRLGMEEIFPIWLRLGSLMPALPITKKEGTLHLLDVCRVAMAANKPETILAAFERLFLAGFEGMLSPRLSDEQYQGIIVPELSEDFSGSPLSLLSESAFLIRGLFFGADGMQILPALPTEFHCGRMLGVQTEVGIIDFEWSKKAIRRMILHADKSAPALFGFQKDIKSFRIRKGNKDRGHRLDCGTSFDVEADEFYYLDNFQR